MLIWGDSFKTYGSDIGALSDGLYAEVGSGGDIVLSPDPDPEASGNVIEFLQSSSLDQNLRYVLPGGAVETVGMGIRFWMSALPPAIERSFNLFQVRDGNNDNQLTLFISTTGNLVINRGGEAGTLLGTSDLPVLVANAWNYIEFKARIHQTLGTTEVHVNKQEVAGLTLINQDTEVSTPLAAQISIVRRGNGSSPQFDYFTKDFAVWDTTGTENNDFLGPVKVHRLAVDADIDFNWTPSSGVTGWPLIEEAGPNDTDLISADATMPPASEFGFDPLPDLVTGVNALIILNRARKSDGGLGSVQASLRSNAVDADGADQALTTAFTYYADVIELDPNTGMPWTKASVDAASVLVNRTL